MALLFTPETSRFEQVALNKAIELAESIIKIEQKIRIGETGTKQPDGQFSEISPMKYFIFDKMGEAFPLWGEMFGEPQNHPQLDDKQQIALLVKIFVNILQSRVVLHVTEAWSVNQCHNCGEKYSTQVINGEPCQCGEKKCQPRENPYATEILMCNVSHFDGHGDKGDGKPTFGGHTWTYEMIRDDQHKVTGFKTIREKEEGCVGGRMSQHWIVHPHEAPIIMLNYPTFCDALGKECPQDIRETVEMALLSMPKDYPMLCWGVHNDVEEVIKVVKEQHKRRMSEFN